MGLSAHGGLDLSLMMHDVSQAIQKFFDERERKHLAELDFLHIQIGKLVKEIADLKEQCQAVGAADRWALKQERKEREEYEALCRRETIMPYSRE